eukprot:gene14359-biopygen567
MAILRLGCLADPATWPCPTEKPGIVGNGELSSNHFTISGNRPGRAGNPIPTVHGSTGHFDSVNGKFGPEGSCGSDAIGGDFGIPAIPHPRAAVLSRWPVPLDTGGATDFPQEPRRQAIPVTWGNTLGSAEPDGSAGAATRWGMGGKGAAPQAPSVGTSGLP